MPHLSASQYDLYTNCPAQWYGQKVLGVVNSEPSEHLILGSAFHNTLEEDGKKRKARQSPHSPEGLLRVFYHQLDVEMARADPLGKLALLRDMLRSRGRAMINAYSDHIAPKYWPVDVEFPFSWKIPDVHPDENGEEWTFDGRVDARTYTASGHVVIIDWKTASKPWTIGSEHMKDQATAYILTDLMMGRTPIAHQVTFITFPTKWNEDLGEFTCTPDIRVTTRTLSQVGDFLQRIQTAAREINLIKRELRDAQARPHWRCQFCPIDILRKCEGGKEWMMSRGRALPFEVEGYTPNTEKKKPAKRKKVADDDLLVAGSEDDIEDGDFYDGDLTA